jgi:hypothetical protein
MNDLHEPGCLFWAGTLLVMAAGAVLAFLLAACVSPILACVVVAVVGFGSAPTCEMVVFAGLATVAALIAIFQPWPHLCSVRAGAMAGCLAVFRLIDLVEWAKFLFRSRRNRL